jgi:hypothetical protein
MGCEGLNVAAFEFIASEDGVAYVHDINTNTNYNSDAEQCVGIFSTGDSSNI